SGAWLLGVIAGSVAFTLIAAAVALTARAEIAETPMALAILLPAVVYVIGIVFGAVRYAWREGDSGLIDRLHDAVDGWGDWGVVPVEPLRGAAAVLAGLTGAAGLTVAVAVATRAGEVVALFEAARVDATGATVLTLGHLAYLPTMLVWALAWI